MTTLRADYGKRTEARLQSYNVETGKLKPEPGIMDPLAPTTRDFLERLYQDLAAYPVDGILLQDDLMLRHQQGFRYGSEGIVPAPETLYEFDRQHRIKAYRPAFSKWRRRQAKSLSDLAEAIFTKVRGRNPKIKLAVNLHYEFLLNHEWSLNWFACSQESRHRSTADYLMVMSYQERMARELDLAEPQFHETMYKLFAQARELPFYSKLVFKFEQPQSVEANQEQARLSQVFQLARKAGWRQFVLFPCNRLLTSNRDLFNDRKLSVTTQNFFDNQRGRKTLD